MRERVNAAAGTGVTGAGADSSDSERTVLELREVEAGYGAFRALFGVSLSVAEGSVTALLGSNGAGKTTVARVCCGLVSPTSGTIRVTGIDLTGSRSWKFARRGVVHVPEGRPVFASLSVEENLRLVLRPTVGRRGVEAALDRAFVEFPILASRRRQQAGTLSGGEQRMLALARALAEPPRLLIADELSLGLAPVVIDGVYETLRAIRDRGTTLLIVEQQVSRALDLADDVVILAKGQVVDSGPSAQMGDAVEQLLPKGVDETP